MLSKEDCRIAVLIDGLLLRLGCGYYPTLVGFRLQTPWDEY